VELRIRKRNNLKQDSIQSILTGKTAETIKGYVLRCALAKREDKKTRRRSWYNY